MDKRFVTLGTLLADVLGNLFTWLIIFQKATQKTDKSESKTLVQANPINLIEDGNFVITPEDLSGISQRYALTHYKNGDGFKKAKTNQGNVFKQIGGDEDNYHNWLDSTFAPYSPAG